MIIDQLAVFSENKAGMLADITTLLAEADIDIEALTIADTADFGVLRLIVDAPKKALAVLKLGGFVASLTPVIAVKTGNDPGSLAKVVRMFAEAEVSIEYLYAFVAREAGTAFMILRVEDRDAGAALLAQNGLGEAFKM
ncbi:MAG: ACT domain-containing protein [Clostridiales Family XIII bacterium]|jgi:hypothetical protein|nr:ACT domain-containing protein [Clostridiales Family XIII bacterium]